MKKDKIYVISKLFPEELFGFILLTVLLVLSLIFNDNFKFEFLIKKYIFRSFIYVFLILIVFSVKLKGLGKLLRNFFPLIIIGATFNTLGEVITRVNPHLADDVLINIDKFLFGGDISLWMQRFYTPWLDMVMVIVYVSYFFIPVALGFIFYILKKFEVFRDYIVALTFTLFIGYIFYIFIPAIGPRFTLASCYTESFKSSAFITNIVNLLTAWEPFKEDCFPSLHAADIFVVMIFSIRYLKKIISIPFFIIGILIIISTVYCQYHYTIDVIAGLVLAALNIYYAPRINKFWNSRVFDGDWRSCYPQRGLMEFIKSFGKIKR